MKRLHKPIMTYLKTVVFVVQRSILCKLLEHSLRNAALECARVSKPQKFQITWYKFYKQNIKSIYSFSKDRQNKEEISLGI